METEGGVSFESDAQIIIDSEPVEGGGGGGGEREEEFRNNRSNETSVLPQIHPSTTDPQRECEKERIRERTDELY